MDEHYDQVMERIASAGNGTVNYFAYSTILDAAAFSEWKEQHGYDEFMLPEGRIGEAREVALAFDFPSRWWGGRVAGLRDAQGSTIWGVLFTIAETDWPIIQHKEGQLTGMSVERSVNVHSGGSLTEAIAFTTNPRRTSAEGEISARFVDALLRGATASKLPDAWLGTIASFGNH